MIPIFYNMFFIDKYNPKNINDTFFNKNILKQLEVMSKDGDVPNIIFYGPDGSGKSTVIRLFLEMIYDKDINKVSEVIYNVTGSGNITTEIKIKQSNYHIIIEPNNNNFDRYLVQDVVKEYAKRIPINIFKTHIKFRTVLINDIQKLSYYAQTSLRRTMEKYSSNCRFILCSSSLSKVLDPLRSRCNIFNIHRPSDLELIEYLLYVSMKENINLELKDLVKIDHISDGNIKDSLWILENKKNHISYNNSYNNAIKEIVNILKNKNIDYLEDIIDLFYKILITNIPGSKIIKDITVKLLECKDISEISKLHIITISSKYESRLIKGRREIIHLQPFICAVFHILKSYENSNIERKQQ